MSEGYLTLALGHQRYYEMALNLALSIKIKDPSRPISLIHDGKIPSEVFTTHFDNLIPMQSLPGYLGCANKLRIWKYSPYQKTMFIDSDCLLLKPDMDRHWSRFQGSAFNVAGSTKSQGKWYNLSIESTCKELDLTHLCVMNSGLIYFTRQNEAEEVFKQANFYFQNCAAVLNATHQGRHGQFADEPFFGAAMARLGISPIEYTPEEGSVMVSTWRAKFDLPDNQYDVLKLYKPKSGHLVHRLFRSFGMIKHSPSIVHFIALKPRAYYIRFTNELRFKFEVPEFNFATN